MSTRLIRLDDEVLSKILKERQGWESPNKTLRRLLRLGPPKSPIKKNKKRKRG